MKDKRITKLLVGAVGLFLIFAVIPGSANAVPRKINYQGYLADNNGAEINGTKDMRFTILCFGEGWYTAWGPEVHESVPVNKGIFNVILASIPNLADQCELGVEVKYGEAYEALSPRQPLTSAAYALVADSVDGYGVIYGYNILDETISTADIQNGTIGNDDISSSANISASKINDGPESGLDADSLDGYNSSSFSLNGHSHNSLNASDGSPSNALYIDDAGEVGIGTLSPSHKLTIANDSADDVLRLTGPDGTYKYGARLNFGDGDLAYIDEDTDDNLTIYASRIALMGTNVGIGTTSPVEKLDVNGNIHATVSTGSVTITTPGSYPGIIGLPPSGNRRDIGFRDSPGAVTIAANNSSGIPSTTDTVWILEEGYVGIGTSGPTQKLDVNGNARFRSIGTATPGYALYRTSDGTLTTSTSDRRVKTNISNIEDGLEVVKKLQGVRFNYKKEPEGKTRIGLIAQDAEKIIPELTFTNPTDGYMGINYPEITAVLIEAVKDQQKIIDDLGAQLDELEENKTAEIDSLRNQISQLRTMIETIMAKQSEAKDNKELVSMSR